MAKYCFVGATPLQVIVNPKFIYKKPTSITKHLDNWYKLCDRNIMDAEDRVELLKEINEDEIILDYLSSNYWRQEKNHKRKEDKLSETDNIGYRLDKFGKYLTFVDQDKYGILSTNQWRNQGKFKDDSKKNGRGNGRRIFYFREFEYRDENGDLRYAGGLERKKSVTDNNVKPEFGSELPEYDITDYVDLGKEEHVFTLIKRYREFDELAFDYEDEDIRGLLDLLDSVIDKAKLKEEERYIVELLKDGEQNYREIRVLVNQEFGKEFNYKKIVYWINHVAGKIAKAYRLASGEVKDKIGKVEPRYTKEQVAAAWQDDERFVHNIEVKQQYNKFVEVKPIHITYWTKEEIEEYLNQKYEDKLKIWELTNKWE